MSFQKAHSISNELGAVYLVSPVLDIDSAMGAAVAFPDQPFFGGRNFRVLEVGFTANTTTATGTTVTIEALAGGAAGTDLVTTQAIPVLAGPDLVNGVAGATVSTSKGGAAAWGFTAAALDTEGVPRLLSGQQLTYQVILHGGTGFGYIWVKLAPEINRDVDA
tara:strand:+ start:2652 stop:3140 length:489 start_codon:yes stop_codon:yes gene_type:complete